MQKVDPPAQVIDAFRDVQAARADLERLQNEAQTYATASFPTRAAVPRKSLQVAEGYQQQAVAEAKGPERAFPQRSTRSTTRQRRDPAAHLFWRRWSVSSAVPRENSSMTAAHSAQSIVPYLPLSELTPRRPPAAPTTGQPQQGGRRAMRSPVTRHCRPDRAVCRHHRRLQLGLSRSRRPNRCWWCGSANPCASVIEPGLNFKAPFIDTVISIDKRILDLENPSQEVIASESEAAGGRRLCPLSHQERAALLPERRFDPGRQHPAHALLNASLRRVLGEVTLSRWCATSVKP